MDLEIAKLIATLGFSVGGAWFLINSLRQNFEAHKKEIKAEMEKLRSDFEEEKKKRTCDVVKTTDVLARLETKVDGLIRLESKVDILINSKN